MAKKDSKTNVTARAELKAKQATCRICGGKSEIVRQLSPGGRVHMVRKCCIAAGISV